MGTLTLKKARARLARELVSWQKAALGLLVLAVLMNMGMMARITSLEDAREADAALRQSDIALYEKRIEQAQRERDFAMDELGTLTASVEADKRARAEQTAAYEAVGDCRYIGECTITYYCPCSECCGRWADGLTATGLPAGPGIVAVDPDVVPLGSTVIIDGQKYLAADTGVTGRHVDICMADHASTVEAGVGTAEVWVVQNA